MRRFLTTLSTLLVALLAWWLFLPGEARPSPTPLPQKAVEPGSIPAGSPTVSKVSERRVLPTIVEPQKRVGTLVVDASTHEPLTGLCWMLTDEGFTAGKVSHGPDSPILTDALPAKATQVVVGAEGYVLRCFRRQEFERALQDPTIELERARVLTCVLVGLSDEAVGRCEISVSLCEPRRGLFSSLTPNAVWAPPAVYLPLAHERLNVLRITAVDKTSLRPYPVAEEPVDGRTFVEVDCSGFNLPDRARSTIFDVVIPNSYPHGDVRVSIEGLGAFQRNFRGKHDGPNTVVRGQIQARPGIAEAIVTINGGSTLIVRSQPIHVDGPGPIRVELPPPSTLRVDVSGVTGNARALVMDEAGKAVAVADFSAKSGTATLDFPVSASGRWLQIMQIDRRRRAGQERFVSYPVPCHAVPGSTQQVSTRVHRGAGVEWGGDHGAAELRISSPSLDADVVFRERGETRMRRFIVLPSGNYTIEAVYPDGKRDRRSIEVGTTMMDVDFTKPQGSRRQR